MLEPHTKIKNKIAWQANDETKRKFTEKLNVDFNLTKFGVSYTVKLTEELKQSDESDVATTQANQNEMKYLIWQSKAKLTQLKRIYAIFGINFILISSHSRTPNVIPHKGDQLVIYSYENNNNS